MAKVYMDYMAVNGELLESFAVAKVLTGFTEEGDGMMIELERTVDNVTLGMDIIFNPVRDEHATPLMVSEEYVKRID